MLAEPDAHAPPQTLCGGRYRVDGILGEGGMGRVFAGYDAQLRRAVAIKAIRSGAAGRLRDEARAMARLHHPNVVDVFDVVLADATVYVVMEQVHGQDLRHWLGSGRPTSDEVITAFVAAGRGLAAAHARGLVHRDFKPANVLRAHDGTIKVVDFGLAIVEDELAATRSALRDTATILGTPKYMAPEQFTTAIADARADQYAFCVALYQALWGRFPFDGELPETIYGAKRRDRVRPPPAEASSGWVWPLMRRGMLADRDARWPSMESLLTALESAGHARRVRRRGIFAVAALSVGAVAAVSWRPTPVEIDGCRAMRQRLADVDVAILEPRFSAAGLDDSVVGWRAALGELAQEQRDLGAELDAACAVDVQWRRACVGRRVDAVVTAHGMLRDGAPGTLGNASGVVRVIASAPRCGDTPEAVVLAPAIAGELDRIRLLEASGDYATAVAAAEALAAQALAAQDPGDAAARAAIALRVGSLRERLGDAAAAESQWREAYFHASAAGAQRLVGEAAVELVFLYGLRHGDLIQAREWARNAEIAIARAELGDRMRAQLARHMGTALRAAGETEAALSQHQRAVELAEGLDVADEDLRAMAYEDLGTTWSSLGRYAEALAMLDAAARITGGLLPARHPDRTIIALNLGIVSKNAERFAEAQHHLSAARTLAAAVLPPSHPRHGGIAIALAEVRRRAGDLDGAESLVREALALHVADRSAAATPPVVIQLAQAEIELARGRPDAALAVVDETRHELPPSASAMFEFVHAAALAATGEHVEADAAFARARAASVRGDRLWLNAAVGAISNRTAFDRGGARQLLAAVRADLGKRDLPLHSAAELALLEAALAEPQEIREPHEADDRLRRADARLGPDDPWNADLRRRIAAAPRPWRATATPRRSVSATAERRGMRRGPPRARPRPRRRRTPAGRPRWSAVSRPRFAPAGACVGTPAGPTIRTWPRCSCTRSPSGRVDDRDRARSRPRASACRASSGGGWSRTSRRSRPAPGARAAAPDPRRGACPSRGSSSRSRCRRGRPRAGS